MLSLVDSMTGNHPARPCLVLSNNAEAGGLKKAAERDIPTAAVDHRPFCKDRAAFEAELSKPLMNAEPDIICLAGFMRVLTSEFVSRFQGRMLNIHPSLLPRYKGLNTHARAIESGDAEHGCTVHEVTAALDDGPILGQARVAIKANDNPEILAARVLTWEHKLYPTVLQRFCIGNTDAVLLP